MYHPISSTRHILCLYLPALGDFVACGLAWNQQCLRRDLKSTGERWSWWCVGGGGLGQLEFLHHSWKLCSIKSLRGSPEVLSSDFSNKIPLVITYSLMLPLPTPFPSMSYFSTTHSASEDHFSDKVLAPKTLFWVLFLGNTLRQVSTVHEEQ